MQSELLSMQWVVIVWVTSSSVCVCVGGGARVQDAPS